MLAFGFLLEGKKRGSMSVLAMVLIITAGVLAILVLTFLALVYIPSPKFGPPSFDPIAPDHWPTEHFRTATTEMEGMDSTKLLEMVAAYQDASEGDPAFDIDSITIVRNGDLVADLYFNPLYPRDTKHVIHSCTKSIVSALIGIAIDQGFVNGVDEKVVDVFPDKHSAGMDPLIAEITLKDLLSMQTGICSQDSYLYGYRGLFELQRTEDWVAHILSLPLEATPGTRFDYSNMSSFLLSAIIQKTTGQNALSFAHQNLFGPLGIKDVLWEESPQGINIGWARMWLKPHDMAKFGLLYLQQGRWDGQQIISTDWVRESLTPHAYPRNYRDVLNEAGEKDNELSMRNWVSSKFLRPFADGYGYQWWLAKDGAFAAMGTAGQYIIVSPEDNLVVAITSQASGLGAFKPAKLFKKYIRKSVVADSPITPNKDAQAQLEALAEPPTLIEVNESSLPLPRQALEISGETYSLEANNWNYDNFKLNFERDRAFAVFSYTAKESEAVTYKVGLDDVYRFSENEGTTYAAKGAWTAADTFEISYQQIGYSNPGSWRLTFKEYNLHVVEMGVTGRYEYSGVQQ